MASGSNRGRPTEIGRPGRFERAGRRRNRWRAAALCGKVAGDGERGAAGLNLRRGSAQEVHHAMRDSPDATSEHGEARREVLGSEAGWRHTGEKYRTGQGQAEGKRGAGRFVTAARRSGEA